MKFQSRKYFLHELNVFFSIGDSHTVVLITLEHLKLEKYIRKNY